MILDFNAYKFGYVYCKAETTFTVYATDCEQVYLALYRDEKSHRYQPYKMKKIAKNIWSVTVDENLDGIYYNYLIRRGGLQLKGIDPYAYACSANGLRSCVIDIGKFNRSASLSNNLGGGMKSAILYETHIRDFTVKTGKSVVNKGKYLGVIEGVAEDDRLKYLSTLGITHIHFLPLQDFASVDELTDDYNWGYDPHHYFIPEGAYVTDLTDPYRRISEMCQMVDCIHQAGLAVVLDVVYNHTYESVWHSFEILAPGVYYRKTPDGKFSNGSGCGNELNSEHPAVRHLIIESLKHWQTFYGFDGFRFDLMALIDMDTMRRVAETLRAINPNVLLYGEPWTALATTLDSTMQFVKGQQRGLAIAVFNDDFRKLLKGGSDDTSCGFIQGDTSQIHHIKTHLLGAIDYSEQHRGFAAEPHESINYISAHDNLILYDKLKKSTNWNDCEIMRATKLAFAMILLSFGIPFIQAGTEFMHSKQMDANSYSSGDEINGILWRARHDYAALYNWVKQLIEFRKSMPCYQKFSAIDIKDNVRLVNHAKVVIIEINQFEQPFSNTLLLFNGSLNQEKISLVIQKDMVERLNSLADQPVYQPELTMQAQQVIVLQQQGSFIKT